jgi:hypothetical protein
MDLQLKYKNSLFETGIPVCRSIAENAAQNLVKFASGDQALWGCGSM